MLSKARYWSSPDLAVFRSMRLATFTADSTLPLALLWRGDVGFILSFTLHREGESEIKTSQFGGVSGDFQIMEF